MSDESLVRSADAAGQQPAREDLLDELLTHGNHLTADEFLARLAVSPNDALNAFRLALREEAQNLEPRQRLYLVALARLSYRMKAMAVAGVSHQTVMRWRRHVPGFVDWEQAAMEVWVEATEQEVDRRAFVGVDEPVFGKLEGKDSGTGIVGHIRRFSDQLAMFRLRAMAPQKYTERRELTGPGGGPVQVEPVVSKLTDRVNEIARKRTPVGQTSPETDDVPRNSD